LLAEKLRDEKAVTQLDKLNFGIDLFARFLYAHSFSSEAAGEAFSKMVRWRKDNNINGILVCIC
jgi:hypothetical protein